MGYLVEERGHKSCGYGVEYKYYGRGVGPFVYRRLKKTSFYIIRRARVMGVRNLKKRSEQP